MTFRLNGVGLRYGRSQPALGPLNLEFQPGDCVAIIGASGSGKTTLLNLLGLAWTESFDGVIEYHSSRSQRSFQYSNLSVSQRDELRAREFGFILQNSYLLPQLTGSDNIGLPLALQGVAAQESRSRINRLLRFADLDPCNPLVAAAARSATECSGGQRQRMAVLRSIIHEPAVVFADEPLGHLDSFNGEAILNLLAEWLKQSADRTLFIVGHDVPRLWDWTPINVFVPLRRGKVSGGRALRRSEVGGAQQLLDLIDPRNGQTA